MEQKLGYNGNYGLELIMDLKGCDLSDLSKEKLRTYFVQLADRIKMVRYGEPIYWEEHSDIPHLRGISAIQFIQTSNFVCHPLPLLNAVYLNVFSCKAFDVEDALRFSMKFWEAKSEHHPVVTPV